MNAAELGSVLIAVSQYARSRAQYHASVNDGNSALVYTLAFMLQTGAEKCLEIASAEVEKEKQCSTL